MWTDPMSTPPADTGESQLPAGAGLTDPHVLDEPYPLYESLHRSCPVGRDPALGWVISRYDDVRSALLNTRDFSSSIAGEDGPRYMGVSPEPLSPEVEELLEQYHPMSNALFTADPPVHTQHRTIVTKALNPRRIRQLEPYMRQIANDCVDSFIGEGRCELLAQFAVPLPLIVTTDTLGIGRNDLEDVKYWSACMMSGDMDPMDNARRAEVARAVIEFQRYMIPLIEERREQPRDDLLNDLVNTEIEADEAEGGVARKLTTAEILPVISQIMLAGHETTTNLIGNGMVLLLQRPELMAELRADFALIVPFLEEVLRFDPPVHCTYRRTTTEVVVAGQAIAAGEMVIPLIGAANQDENVFEDPRTFDMRRPNVRRHLGFGVGPHFCPGAEMARVEARVGLEVLLNRLDDIKLASGAELTHHPNLTRGYHAVPIEFTARSGA
jgi:cytochrome P450